MYAMAYGAIPIVSNVGGLRDTVQPMPDRMPSKQAGRSKPSGSSQQASQQNSQQYSQELASQNHHGYGFVIHDFSVQHIVGVIQQAATFWHHEDQRLAWMKANHQVDFSWSKSAEATQSVYEDLQRKRIGA
jgi:glycogen synthase